MSSKYNGLIKYESVDYQVSSVPILVEDRITILTQRVAIRDFKGSIFQTWTINSVGKKLPQLINDSKALTSSLLVSTVMVTFCLLIKSFTKIVRLNINKTGFKIALNRAIVFRM